MVLAEISIKLIFSQKERFSYELSLLQGYARKHVFLLSIIYELHELSIYRSLLILCESWMRVSIVTKLVQIFY